MIDFIINYYLGKHPGRGEYKPTDCRIYDRALQDKEYKMSEGGRHPFNILTMEVLGD